MAIYRPPGRRWPAVAGAGIGGTVAGLLVGLLLFGGNDPVAGARKIRSEMARAAGSLEVAQIEYEEAAESGSGSERAGALDALSSSREIYEAIRPALVELWSEPQTEAIDQLYEALVEDMEAGASSEIVSSAIKALMVILKDD